MTVLCERCGCEVGWVKKIEHKTFYRVMVNVCYDCYHKARPDISVQWDDSHVFRFMWSLDYKHPEGAASLIADNYQNMSNGRLLNLILRAFHNFAVNKVATRFGPGAGELETCDGCQCKTNYRHNIKGGARLVKYSICDLCYRDLIYPQICKDPFITAIRDMIRAEVNPLFVARLIVANKEQFDYDAFKLTIEVAMLEVARIKIESVFVPETDYLPELDFLNDIFSSLDQ